jgi:hypothetical protein
LGYDAWLGGRNVDASKKNFFVVTGILVFDFELFIGAQGMTALAGRR